MVLVSFCEKMAPENESGVDGGRRSLAGLNVELDLWTPGRRPCRFGVNALPPKPSGHQLPPPEASDSNNSRLWQPRKVD